MNKEDKIVERFKKNQHRLDEMPSAVAWQRLESRLDARRASHQRQRANKHSFVAMTAAAVLFIGFFGFLGWYFATNSNVQLADNDAASPTQQMETNQEIVSIEIENQPEPTVVGDPNQPTLTQPIHSVQTPSTNKTVAIQNPPAPPPLLQPTTQLPQTTVTSTTRGTSASDMVASELEYPTLPTEANIPILTTETTKKEAEEKYIDDQIAIADHKIATTKNAPILGASKPAAAPAPVITTAPTIGKDEAYKGYGEFQSNTSSIQEFKWLIGTWTENTSNGTSTEAWKWSDSKTLKAEANVNTNGKTTFKETITIKETKSGLILTTAVDTKKTASYTLQSLENNQAIFVNNTMDFPHQIIIQQIDNSQFSTTFVGRGTPPNESQMNYITNRNNVSLPNKAARVLKRTN